MRLASVFFSPPLPIPGTGRHEASLHASDGWELERLDDGRVRFSRMEPVDLGGTRRVGGTAERWACVYVWDEEADTLAALRNGGRTPSAREVDVMAIADAVLGPSPIKPEATASILPEPPTGKRRRGK